MKIVQTSVDDMKKNFYDYDNVLSELKVALHEEKSSKKKK